MHGHVYRYVKCAYEYVCSYMCECVRGWQPHTSSRMHPPRSRDMRIDALTHAHMPLQVHTQERGYKAIHYSVPLQCLLFDSPYLFDGLYMRG